MKEPSESRGNIEAGLGDSDLGSLLFEKFAVLEVIADGGKGRVYKVRNIDLNNLYALKVLSTKTISNEDLVRFQKEAKIASKLTHPNIATVYDFGTYRDVPYLVMELVNGTSLDQYLRQRRVLNQEEFLSIFIQVSKALVHAHQLNVIHRDVKPGNIGIQVDDNGLTVKLLDFGLAKTIELDAEKIGRLTASGSLVGTPWYMSPEQTRALNLTPKTDCYSLGCVMWQSLVGQPPFKGYTAFETLLMHQNQAPESVLLYDADIPTELAKLIDELLKKDPLLRPDLKEHVLPTLEELNSKLHMAHGRDESPQSTRTQTKARGMPVLGGFVIAALGLCFSILYFQSNNQHREHPGKIEDLVTVTDALPPEDQIEKNSVSPTIGIQPAPVTDFSQFARAVRSHDNKKIIDEGVRLAHLLSEDDYRKPRQLSEFFGEIATSYEALNDFDNAAVYYQKALEMANKVAKSDLPFLRWTSSLLRVQSRSNGYRASPLNLLKDADSLALKLYGKDTVAYAFQMMFHGDLNATDYTTAMRYYLRCLDSLRTAKSQPPLPPVNHLRGLCFVNMALLQSRSNNEAAAAQNFKRGLELLAKERLSPDGQALFVNRSITGIDVLFRQGKLEDAKKMSDQTAAWIKGRTISKELRKCLDDRRVLLGQSPL